MGNPPEIAISRAWHDGQFGEVLSTTEGVAIQVVHRGVWSHGLGPDFRDAMIALESGELRTGAVEIHRQTSEWYRHGHDGDPAYNEVMLHLVLQHDGSKTRTAAGRVVPVVELPNLWLVGDGQGDGQDWERVGGAVCAEQIAKTDPHSLRLILWQLGDTRLAAKIAQVEAELTAVSPAVALQRALWDGFGFLANREPMRQLARNLPISVIESVLAKSSAQRRLTVALGLLFGAGGFLPLAPADANDSGCSPAQVSELERAWFEVESDLAIEPLAPTIWSRQRIRPANHPARRLVSCAQLLVNCAARGGLLVALLDLVGNEADLCGAFRRLTAGVVLPAIGTDRAVALLANGVIPVASAWATRSGDEALLEQAGLAWEKLPSGSLNTVSRRAYRQVAGGVSLGKIGERGHQGLIHLDQGLCSSRRCFECPVAGRVVHPRSFWTE